MNLVNGCRNEKILTRHYELYQSGSDERVQKFCDTEKKLLNKINEFHDMNNVADKVVTFENPGAMQIVLKHWTDGELKDPAKQWMYY